MKVISISISGFELDYGTAHDITIAMAKKANPDTMLVAWFDEKLNRHSPTHVECAAEGIPGWESYGKHHEGKLKMTINDGEYVFIYT